MKSCCVIWCLTKRSLSASCRPSRTATVPPMKVPSQLNSLLIPILSTQNSRQNSGKIWRPGFLQDLQLSLDVVGASCSLNPKGKAQGLSHFHATHGRELQCCGSLRETSWFGQIIYRMSKAYICNPASGNEVWACMHDVGAGPTACCLSLVR